MLSLILPTYNEAKNLSELIPALKKALQGIPHEIIVVDDDSPDRTWEAAQELGREFTGIRVIRRIGRRGLSSAVIEGFLAAKGGVLAVMDADGQHDRGLLPALYDDVRSGRCSIAIGSRFAEGGSVGSFGERRLLMSRVATRLALQLCRGRVRDPMSGFFAIDRALFAETRPKLCPRGFKILLDLLVHAPGSTRVREIPFTFGERLHGSSKLNMKVKLQFLAYLCDVTAERYASRTVLLFLALCLLIGAVLSARVWSLRLLYSDADVRAATERTVREVAARKGWLISDMEVKEISRERVVVGHRAHSRFRDPARCFVLSQTAFTVSPCES